MVSSPLTCGPRLTSFPLPSSDTPTFSRRQLRRREDPEAREVAAAVVAEVASAVVTVLTALTVVTVVTAKEDLPVVPPEVAVAEVALALLKLVRPPLLPSDFTSCEHRS
jgi:hypothetical protein